MLRRTFLFGLLSSFILFGSTRCTFAQDRYGEAYKILGGDFIFPDNMMQFQKQSYSPKQLETLYETLPSPKVLHWCKVNNYAVMPGPAQPLSLKDIRTKIQPKRFFYSDTVNWYFSHDFFTADEVDFGWLAISKDALPGSLNRTMSEQRALLSVDQYVPNVAELAWMMTTLASVRGVRPFETSYVRTSSVIATDQRSNHVTMGDFDGFYGFCVFYELDTSRSNYHGLSAGLRLVR